MNYKNKKREKRKDMGDYKYFFSYDDDRIMVLPAVCITLQQIAPYYLFRNYSGTPCYKRYAH